MGSLPPFLIMLAGAAVVPALPARMRGWAFLAAPLITLAHLVLWLDRDSHLEVELAGLSLGLLEVNHFNEVWGTVFALVALGGGLFGLRLSDRVQQGAALAYGGSAFGVLFAGDLITLIVFWELMAVTSFLLIVNGGRPDSRAAAMRYLFVHVAGGAAFLGGILWHAGDTGSVALGTFEQTPAGWLALLGVLVNAAGFPFHSWLSDAYPESGVSGMVFLAYTTKTAVYVLVELFAGWGILVIVGSFTTLYASVYSLLQNDARRIIAYQIISPVGFMTAEVGIGTAHALEGVAAHAFTHVLWQSLMVMGAGTVLYAAGTSKLTELGGLARPLRFVFALYLVGAVSLAILQLQTSVGSSLSNASELAVGLVLAAAAAVTIVAVVLRIPYYIFFGEPRGLTLRPIPASMYAAMGAAAALSIAAAIEEGWLFSLFRLEVHAENVGLSAFAFGAQAALLAGVAGWFALPWLKPRDGVVLDTDWLYRKAGPLVRQGLQVPLESAFTACERAVAVASRRAGALTAPSARLARMGRPPVGAALAAVLLTFAVVALLAWAIGG